jgi:excisionase family DNA binding protein
MVEMKLVGVAATATRMGVSPYTLRAWIRQGRIPFVRLGRRVLFDPADVDRFIKANRVEARMASKDVTAETVQKVWQ